MKIFKAEIADGLQEIIHAQSSISYAAQVEPSSIEHCSKIKDIKALAGLEDKDLYYTQSILVTTSWNKNDDIFDKEQVWSAKNTPIHKPTNLEHNESAIVGHITSNWPITDDGILIDESTPVENLPNKYHILTGSVIYTGYTEPELKERSQKLIAEIENGTKYVSMECFFKAFDYGLINKSTGEYKILDRNEDTAFLTKHLRAYGGLGEYQDHKIGRVLKEITFSGKGFVDKPANPESVIFTKNNINFNQQISLSESQKEKNNDFLNVGVFSNQANLKENDMSLEKEVAEIKEKIEAMADCKNAIAEAKSVASDLETQNKELSDALKAKEAELEEIKAALTEKETSIQSMADEIQKIKTEFDATNEVLAAYKDKEAEMMKKEKKMKRMATLLEYGLDSELVNSTVEKFENLDDSSFDGMAEVFAAMMPKKKMAEETTTKKKMEEEALMKKRASEEESQILETAETEETIDLSVGSEDQVSEVENTRAALVDFVYNRLGKKLNKGE
jgi:copper chaperone CopZ